MSIDSFDESLLDQYTDDEIIQFVDNSPALVTTRVEATKGLSHGLIAKFVSRDAYDDEVEALELTRKLGILVPALRRRVARDTDTNDCILIMDRIHGRTLEELWSKIGWWKTLSVAWQLRRYLRIMRRVTSPTAGGLSTGLTRSLCLECIHGPVRNASPEVFTNYLNWWLTSCRPTYLRPRRDLLLEPLPEHTFIHQDLAPRNMILDTQNRLWLVDWGYAGYYPIYFEYNSIETTAMPWIYASSWRSRLARWRWAFLRWIAAGQARPHPKQCKALAEVHRRSCIFRLDRSQYSEG